MTDQPGPTITREVAARVLTVVDAGLVDGLGHQKPGEMCVEAAVCFALGLPHGDNPACVARSLRSLKIKLNDSSWSSPKARAAGLRRLAVAQLGSAGALDEAEFVRRVVDYAIRISTPQALRSAASIQKDHKHKAALLDAAARCEREGTKESAIAARKTATTAAAAYAYATAATAYATTAAAAYAYAAAAAADAYAATTAYATAATAYAAAAAAAYAYAAADADAYAATTAYATAYARDKSLAAYAEVVVQILIEMKAPGCQWLDLTEAA